MYTYQDFDKYLSADFVNSDIELRGYKGTIVTREDYAGDLYYRIEWGDIRTGFRIFTDWQIRHINNEKLTLEEAENRIAQLVLNHMFNACHEIDSVLLERHNQEVSRLTKKDRDSLLLECAKSVFYFASVPNNYLDTRQPHYLCNKITEWLSSYGINGVVVDVRDANGTVFYSGRWGNVYLGGKVYHTDVVESVKQENIEINSDIFKFYLEKQIRGNLEQSVLLMKDSLMKNHIKHFNLS